VPIERTRPAVPSDFKNGGAEQGDKTTGGNWLHDNAGKKITFRSNAKQAGSGFDGHLQLHDKPAGVKVRLNDVTFLGAVDEPCG
jgi:hypothetical protein